MTPYGAVVLNNVYEAAEFLHIVGVGYNRIGTEYTIADIAIWPWYGAVVLNNVYEAAEFLDAGSYKHLGRWNRGAGRRAARTDG